jgi:hypothetical protein
MPALQPDLDNVNWHVSERCDGGACVAVGCRDGSILVGNTMQPDGPYVTYTAAAWKKFLFSVKQGDFDDPA